MNEVIEYSSFIDTLKDYITEGEHHSTWFLVLTFHSVGQTIREYYGDKPLHKVLHDLANDLNIKRWGERNLYYAVELFDRYPKTDSIPEGKAISMNKLKTKYLPKHSEDKVESENNMIPCPKCKGKGKIKGGI